MPSGGVPRLDALPGFRRRFIVTPGPDWVQTEVEDDYHCMSVVLRHRDGVVVAVEGVMDRAPWDTCPGAIAQLKRTFTNVALNSFVARGEKPSNCTHLHDLAVLAAAHARDASPLVYDILVSDPIDGISHAELRRNGETVMRWATEDFQLVEPPDLRGVSLHQMRPWIDTLDTERQEYARILRWATMLSHGRAMPMEQQSNALNMRMGSCFTFQPDIAKDAHRIGEIREFSKDSARPLEPTVRKRLSVISMPVT